MADIRIHRYTVDPKDFEEFATHRAALISTMRAAQPGLVEARLIRLADDTFVDTWRWDSAEHMQAGFAAARTIPEIPAAMSLTRDATNEDGEIIDER